MNVNVLSDQEGELILFSSNHLKDWLEKSSLKYEENKKDQKYRNK